MSALGWKTNDIAVSSKSWILDKSRECIAPKCLDFQKSTLSTSSRSENFSLLPSQWLRKQCFKSASWSATAMIGSFKRQKSCQCYLAKRCAQQQYWFMQVHLHKRHLLWWVVMRMDLVCRTTLVQVAGPRHQCFHKAITWLHRSASTGKIKRSSHLSSRLISPLKVRSYQSQTCKILASEWLGR